MLRKLALTLPPLRRVQEDRVKLRETVASLSSTVGRLRQRLARQQRQAQEQQQQIAALSHEFASKKIGSTVVRSITSTPRSIFAPSLHVMNIPTAGLDPAMWSIISELP